MASAASDSDTEMEPENETRKNGTCELDENQNPDRPKRRQDDDDDSEGTGRKSKSTESRRCTETTVNITKTRIESIQGLDDLTSCINSVDDHVQAGLQELRNCVTNLRKEKTEISEKIRSLSDEIVQVSSERDQCQVAVLELQEEVTALREHLRSQQHDKESLLRRIQEIQQRNEDHLVKIAGKQRHRRLAHNAIVRWRRKALDKGLGCRERLRLLEEENNDLRAELLLCQEAAKQAFLRSANALNSEAITMFQDAATRRLGCEETSQESPASHFSSPSDSPVPPPHSSHDREYVGSEATGGDKENMEKYRDGRSTQRTGNWDRHIDEIRCSGSEGAGGGEDNRSYIATYGSDDQNNLNIGHGDHSSSYMYHRQRLNQADFDGYRSHDPRIHESANLRTGRPYHYTHTSKEYGAAGVGLGPSQNKPLSVSGFEPNTLQQETRAYLQQLREDRMRRPEPPVASGFESQHKTQKTAQSQQDPKRRTCSCRSRVGANLTSDQMPYKCPYCTPVQNSSYGHAKDVHKKSSNVTRSTILSGTNTDKKKVVYRPSASTIVIEKHITR